MTAPLPSMPTPTPPLSDAALAEMQRTAWAVLESVPDPEIPVVSLRELGILRDVQALCDDQGHATLRVTITPTYSGCPAMAQIAEDVTLALRAAQLPEPHIHTVLAPAWTTDWITPEAREKLRAYGIAPPGPVEVDADSGGATVHALRFMPRAGASAPPACPRCGSVRTEELSRHGSTACKALYRCLSCREPFDHFKPH